MHWYDPKTRVAETVPAPYTDEEAEYMLGGTIDSWTFGSEYGKLRGDGLGIEQAMIFVGHRFGCGTYGICPSGKPKGHDPSRARANG